MKTRRSRATDHRGVVLEAIASSPWHPARPEVLKDCVGPDFSAKNVGTMINQLGREGLVQRTATGQYFLTQAGYAYLQQAAFDRALGEFTERPGGRKPRKKREP